MPFITADRRVAQALAREAEKFARRVRQIPVDKDAGPHPEVKEVLAAFQRINKLMAKQRGIVTLSQKVRIGREFQAMGSALRSRRRA
ncbi:MAG: hypothetical protein E6I87_01770 [Chloroflexi bacterium]|nr:MAG: hypothetical protein E6I87_01770 [Chloroflexota bacterium]